MAKAANRAIVTTAATAGSQRVAMGPVSFSFSLSRAAGLAVSATPARVASTTTATISARGRSDGAYRSR